MDKALAISASLLLAVVGAVIWKARKEARLSPGWLFIVVWSGSLLLYGVTPIWYAPGLSMPTLVFIVLAALAFALPDIYNVLLGRPASKTQSSGERLWVMREERFNRLIAWLCALGVVGSAMYTYDKLWLSGVDYSELAVAREVLFVTSETEWGLIGAALYPFGSVALILAILYQERARPYTLLAAAMSGLLGTPWVSMLNVGKSGLFVFVALTIGAFIVRWRWGLRPIQHKSFGRILVMSAAGLSAVGFVSFSLRGFFGADTWMYFLERFDAAVPSGLIDMYDSLGPDWSRFVFADAMMLLLYLTHSLNNLEKFMMLQSEVSLQWGVNQDRFIGPALREIIVGGGGGGSGAALQQFIGVFNTWHYGTILDFGYWGALIFYVGVGMLMQVAFYRAASRWNLAAALITSQCYVLVILSPMVTPLSAGNAFQLVITSAVTGCVGRAWGVFLRQGCEGEGTARSLSWMRGLGGRMQDVGGVFEVVRGIRDAVWFRR